MLKRRYLPVDLIWCLQHAIQDECPPENRFYKCMKSEVEEVTQNDCVECWMAFAVYATEVEPVLAKAVLVVE